MDAAWKTLIDLGAVEGEALTSRLTALGRHVSPVRAKTTASCFAANAPSPPIDVGTPGRSAFGKDAGPRLHLPCPGSGLDYCCHAFKQTTVQWAHGEA